MRGSGRRRHRSVERFERTKKLTLSFSTPTSSTFLYSCNSTIARLERVDADALFVSPLTLQSFTNEAALEESTKWAYARLLAMPQGVLAAGRGG
jgi:hypothetical protein